MDAALAATREGPAHRAWAFLPFAIGASALVAQAISTPAAIGLGLAYFAIGIAHGAADEQDGRIARFGVLSAAAYIVSGLAITALFVIAPLAGLTLFLALSAWHFARSVEGARLRGIALAALATGGSMLFHFAQTSEIFTALTGSAIPAGWLYFWAMAGAAGLAAAIARLLRKPDDYTIWLAVFAVGLLHPVLAVGTVFLIGHAMPVQGKQIDAYGRSAVVSAQAPATIAALAGAGALVLLWHFDLVPLALLAAAAFGFATPHMLAERLER